MNKKRWLTSGITFLIGLYPSLFLAYHTHYFLLGKIDGVVWSLPTLLDGFTKEKNIRIFAGVYLLTLLLILLWSLVEALGMNYKSGMQEIIPGIKTPLPAGENQYGSARWLRKNEIRKTFLPIKLNPKSDIAQWLVATGDEDLWDDYNPINNKVCEYTLFPAGGVVVGQDKSGKKLYIVDEDTHSLTIGATRSSKSRSVVLPSICVIALAGESMIITDAKGELYFYTVLFLLRLGYEVIAIDFENPKKSDQYNFMQIINDQLEKGDITDAKTATNELVEGLVGKGSEHGERIWTEGEKSIMACCIMAVAYDNRNRPQYQNLTNVYHFIARMCAPQEGEQKLPLEAYLAEQSDDHPAKALAGISNVAHFRTRSSFYAAALATLRLFEDYNVADMTSRTSFDIYKTGVRKRAIFIILPDEKDAFYSVASLFIYQHYQTIVGVAKENGGRLERRVECVFDEVGNFTYIPSFQKLITVGGGRGLRFHLFLQDTKQLDEVYNQNISSIIRNNCETWIYLQADDADTLEDISRKMGEYTTKSPNLSTNTKGTGGSASYGYISRRLLTSDEVKKVQRPYQLVLSRKAPTILYAPDISKTIFNDMLGMGDENHNIRLTKIRNNRRKERLIKKPYLWGIWKEYENVPPTMEAPPPQGESHTTMMY